MALLESLKRSVESKLEKYCEKKIPAQNYDRVKFGFRFSKNSVTLFEERPAFDFPEKWVRIPVAQFRYDPKDKMWTLYCANQHSKWELYLDAESTSNFDDLLREVDSDPTGIFWG